MAACNVQSLTTDASCFFCLPNGYYYPLKLALLARWIKLYVPSADTSPNALLADAACFSCLAPGHYGPLRLALLCRILNGTGGGGGGGTTPNPPTSLDITDASTNGATHLTWSQGSAPTTNEVWVSINGAAFLQRTSQAGALTTYTDPNALANGDVWQYKVRAVTSGTPSSFGNTVRVGRALDFNNTGLVSFSYADMVHIYDDLTIQNEALLPSILLPALRVVDAAFLVLACPALTTINVAALKTVSGNFGPQGNNALTTLNCAALVTVGQAFAPSSNPALTSLSVPNLVTANVVDCGGCGYTSLSFPALTTCSTDFAFAGCTSLLSVTANALTSALTDIFGSGCTVLKSVSMPNVTYIDGGTFDLSACALLVATVDQVLHHGVVSATLTATYDLSGGTNAGPTNDCNLGSDCDILTSAGNNVTTN